MKTKFLILKISIAFMIMFTPVYSNVQDDFRLADKYFIQNEPLKAIKLYKSIVVQNSNKDLTILAKYKIAYLLDNKLHKYEEAINAYKEFLNNYPKKRLAIIAKKRYTKLQYLKQKKLLKTYFEFKCLESNCQKYQSFSKKIPHSFKVASKKLGDFAIKNINVSFADEIIKSTMGNLVQAELYVIANRLKTKIDQERPYLKRYYIKYQKSIKLNIKRHNIFLFCLSFISLLLLVLIINKSWLQLIPTITNNKILFIISASILLMYITLFYFIFITKDKNTNLNLFQLIILLIYYIILMFLSILISNSFNFIKKKLLKYTLQIIISISTGIAVWFIFAYQFDYLWLIKL